MNRKIRKRLVDRGHALVPPAEELRAAERRAAPAAARARAAEILAEGTGTVVALEAALALRLDPDCVPAMANLAAARTERTPPRILDWLRRRRSA